MYYRSSLDVRVVPDGGKWKVVCPQVGANVTFSSRSEAAGFMEFLNTSYAAGRRDALAALRELVNETEDEG